MPTNPKAPTIATKPNSLPAISIPATTPVMANGKHNKIISGLRKSLNRAINIANMSTIAIGTFLNK